MRKSLYTALVVAAGIASQAGAATPSSVHITNPGLTVPTTKLGLLTITLNNQFQAYDKPTGSGIWGVTIKPARIATPARTWDNKAYDYLSNCLGAVTFRSNTKQVNNAVIIDSINAALSQRGGLAGAAADGIFVKAGSPYIGGFGRTTAKIVVVNYENGQQMPPFPSTVDNFYAAPPVNVWNAPYTWFGFPDPTGIDGQEAQLIWPGQNYIAWGKPDPAAFPTANWIGARVFVIDPKNANPFLRCFDVTPFFALEESFCKFCWDTMDRVTDGSITRGTTISDPPCATGGISCGVKGSGTTKFYWTVKFNNVGAAWVRNPNYQIAWYYINIMGLDPLSTYGAKLDDTDINGSLTSLAFTVNGVATYSWMYKKLSDGFNWPMGTMSMSSGGHGYSPMCGVFTGPVSIVEYDKSYSLFGGVWCVAP